MKERSLALLLVLLASAHAHTQAPKANLETAFQWDLLEYGFPSARDRQQAVSDGNLVPENGIPIDVAPFYNANGNLRVFTTVPRFLPGVPYSLATVTERPRGAAPVLQPYPNYEMHSSHGANCDGITSAFRVAITECQQMWVIDSGVIGTEQLCPPQLLLFDLATDRLLQRFRFPGDLYIPVASLMITPVVDVQDPPPAGRCQRAMVYVADVTNHAVIVYDQGQNAGWRVENRFMYPDPDFGVHTIAGESFTLMDGILGMSVDKRNLYFHPMASTSEYVVPLSVLNNRTVWEEDSTAMGGEFRAVGNRGSESAAEAMDSRGNLYFATFEPIRLYSWNVNRPYRPKYFRVLSADAERLQFISGMKVVRNPAGREELWMMSNRFQKIAAGTQDPNEVNFRILKRSLDDVLTGIDYENDLHNRLIFN